MGVVVSILNYTAYALLIYGGYNAYKVYKERKYNDKEE